MKEQLIQDFIKIYGGGEDDLEVFFSPGRVNLIGEHIDYNGGFVFPCALDIGTYMVVRKREDDTVRFASLNMDLKTQIKLGDGITYLKEHEWSNYPKGIMKYFIDDEKSLGGMDLLYFGNIPNGSGLSSSASLEVVTAFAMNSLYNGGYSLLELVKLSQSVERGFMGVNCGIMDQFAVGFGKENAAILLNCDTLEYEYAPLKMGDYKIVICNTEKKRGLADSKYNERRGECESALQKLQTKAQINHLCDLTVEQFEAIKDVIDDAVELKRAEHAVYENERVKDAVKVLNADDLVAFGQLLNASHASLRDLYEVSCTELDVMVEEAQKIDGTLGARMTGAGFGGCTVNIVREDAIPAFIKTVSENYEKRTGLVGEIYIASVGDGVKAL